MKNKLKSIKNKLKIIVKCLRDPSVERKIQLGENYLNNPYHTNARKLTAKETSKPIKRFDVINFCLAFLKRETTYLELGVREPDDNFNKIQANIKYSVDPGLESKINKVDFKMTSDEFFKKLSDNKVLCNTIKFDLIFIDGLHLAEQVERDIINSLIYLKEDGFIILHDCNPPTESHAREEFRYIDSPAGGSWNGTVWKAFYKYRLDDSVNTCCVDTDWGIGVLHKKLKLAPKPKVNNPFFEYHIFNENRQDSLGLISFNDFKNKCINA